MGFRAFLLFGLLVFSLSTADARNILAVRKVNSVLTEHVEARVPEVVESNKEVCAVCQNVTGEAIKYLNDDKTKDEITNILRDMCSQLSILEQECGSMVDYYTERLFAEISKLSPQGLCKAASLCETQAIPALVGGESTCAFCHHIVQEIIQKLKNPDSQFEILELLLKECSRFEGHVQQCKRLVLQYSPLILVTGERFLEKNDVCEIIHASPSSAKQFMHRVPLLPSSARSDRNLLFSA